MVSAAVCARIREYDPGLNQSILFDFSTRCLLRGERCLCWTTSQLCTSRRLLTFLGWLNRVSQFQHVPLGCVARQNPFSRLSLSALPPLFKVNVTFRLKKLHKVDDLSYVRNFSVLMPLTNDSNYVCVYIKTWIGSLYAAITPFPYFWNRRYLKTNLIHWSACLGFIFSGLQPSSKSSSFPVRMENSVPIVPQNQSAQSLQIQPSMLTQVRVCKVCKCAVRT